MGLVAGGGHHSPWPGATDDHWFAPEAGFVTLLHRSEERIQVQVQDTKCGSHTGQVSDLSRHAPAGSFGRRGWPVLYEVIALVDFAADLGPFVG